MRRRESDLRPIPEGVRAPIDMRNHEVNNAGHWLHVDNPGGLRDVLAPEMARSCASLTS